MRTTHLLFTATVALAVVATAACFKKKDDTTTTEDAAAATPSATDTAAEAPAEINPAWKTKCPAADRPASGTVTALKDLVVHESPDDNSKHIGSIGPGTWVNLLGVKQQWYCIDYPCDVGKLCPGWVEDRYTQRKAPVKDAGVPEAAAPVTVDAAVPAVVDAGKALVPDAATPTTTVGKAPPGGRPPPIKKK